MFSFEVQPETHKKVSKVSKSVAYLGFVAAVIFFVATAVTTYKEASEILADHTVVDAYLQLDDVTQERGRKGRTREIYHFSYEFDVNGKNYKKAFNVNESNADKYIDLDTLKIAYSNKDPQLNGQLEMLERNNSISSMLKRLAIAIPFLALLSAAVFYLITAKLIVPKPEQEA